MSRIDILWVMATGLEARSLGISENLPAGFYPDVPKQGQALLLTGVGMLPAAVALTRTLLAHSVQLVINAGVAGSFREAYAPGMVVQVVVDQIADFGVEDGECFRSVFEIGLVDANTLPFSNGVLKERKPVHWPFALPRVSGVTVNKVHGEAQSILAFSNRTSADVETMEGAAVFYAAASIGVACVQIRAISNRVEPRNRANWKMEAALLELGRVIQRILSETTSFSS